MEESKENTRGSGEETKKNKDDFGEVSTPLDTISTIKNFLAQQQQIQPTPHPQLLQVPLVSSQVNLSRISPIQKLRLRDIFHNTVI